MSTASAKKEQPASQPIYFSIEREEVIADRLEIGKKSRHFERLITEFTSDHVISRAKGDSCRR